MKTRHKRFVLGFSLVCVLFALTGTILLRSLTPYPAPDVVFKTIHGEQIALSDLRGKPVLINFWASTCGYCLEEMPHLADLYREIPNNHLQIIGVAMPYDMPSRVVQISQQLNLPYPVAIDPDNTIASAFNNVRFTPTSFLIDTNGIIIDKTIGQINLNRVRKQINQL